MDILDDYDESYFAIRESIKFRSTDPKTSNQRKILGCSLDRTKAKSVSNQTAVIPDWTPSNFGDKRHSSRRFSPPRRPQPPESNVESSQQSRRASTPTEKRAASSSSLAIQSAHARREIGLANQIRENRPNLQRRGAVSLDYEARQMSARRDSAIAAPSELLQRDRMREYWTAVDSDTRARTVESRKAMSRSPSGGRRPESQERSPRNARSLSNDARGRKDAWLRQSTVRSKEYAGVRSRLGVVDVPSGGPSHSRFSSPVHVDAEAGSPGLKSFYAHGVVSEEKLGTDSSRVRGRGRSASPGRRLSSKQQSFLEAFGCQTRDNVRAAVDQRELLRDNAVTMTARIERDLRAFEERKKQRIAAQGGASDKSPTLALQQPVATILHGRRYRDSFGHPTCSNVALDDDVAVSSIGLSTTTVAPPPHSNQRGQFSDYLESSSSSLRSRDVASAEWGRLLRWLEDKGLEKYADNFSKGGITKLSVMELLHAEDLSRLGISHTDIQCIIMHINEFSSRTRSFSQQAIDEGVFALDGPAVKTSLGHSQSVSGESEKILQNLLNSFDAGDASMFEDNWVRAVHTLSRRAIGSQRKNLARAQGLQSLHFNVQLHFAVFPLLHNLGTAACSAAMNRLRRELDKIYQQCTDDPTVAITTTQEFALYSGIVFTPNPQLNRAYAPLFESQWSRNLRKKLELFMKLTGLVDSSETSQIAHSSKPITPTTPGHDGATASLLDAKELQDSRDQSDVKQALFTSPSTKVSLKDIFKPRNPSSMSPQPIVSPTTNHPLSSKIRDLLDTAKLQRLELFKQSKLHVSAGSQGSGGGALRSTYVDRHVLEDGWIANDESSGGADGGGQLLVSETLRTSSSSPQFGVKGVFPAANSVLESLRVEESIANPELSVEKLSLASPGEVVSPVDLVIESLEAKALETTVAVGIESEISLLMAEDVNVAVEPGTDVAVASDTVVVEPVTVVVEPVAVGPVVVEHVAVGPVAVEPVAVEPAAVEPVTVEPVAVEPVAVEPEHVAMEPVTVESEPIAVEPVVVEPAAVEHVAVEPAAVEPAAVEPAAVEPVAVEPVAVEPVTVESEPIAVEPVVVEPEHVAVEPVTVESEPIAVEPVAVEPEHVAMEPVTVEPVTVESEPVTVEPVTVESEPIAVEPVVVEPVVVEPVAVEPVVVETDSSNAPALESLSGLDLSTQSDASTSIGVAVTITSDEVVSRSDAVSPSPAQKPEPKLNDLAVESQIQKVESKQVKAEAKTTTLSKLASRAGSSKLAAKVTAGSKVASTATKPSATKTVPTKSTSSKVKAEGIDAPISGATEPVLASPKPNIGESVAPVTASDLSPLSASSSDAAAIEAPIDDKPVAGTGVAAKKPVAKSRHALVVERRKAAAAPSKIVGAASSSSTNQTAAVASTVEAEAPADSNSSSSRALAMAELNARKSTLLKGHVSSITPTKGSRSSAAVGVDRDEAVSGNPDPASATASGSPVRRTSGSRLSTPSKSPLQQQVDSYNKMVKRASLLGSDDVVLESSLQEEEGAGEGGREEVVPPAAAADVGNSI